MREISQAEIQHGLWLSLVERLVRDQEAVGSNPTSPIDHRCSMSPSAVRFVLAGYWLWKDGEEDC